MKPGRRKQFMLIILYITISIETLISIIGQGKLTGDVTSIAETHRGHPVGLA